MAITGTTPGDMWVRAETSEKKRGRGRPKKVRISKFTEGEKRFILEHAQRGKIMEVTFEAWPETFYYIDYRRINYGDKGYKYLMMPTEIKTKYQEKVQKNKTEFKAKLIKAISECDEIEVTDDGQITTFTLEPETDELILARYESYGRGYLAEEFKRYQKKIKSERRTVLVEKIKKPKKRKKQAAQIQFDAPVGYIVPPPRPYAPYVQPAHERQLAQDAAEFTYQRTPKKPWLQALHDDLNKAFRKERALNDDEEPF